MEEPLFHYDTRNLGTSDRIALFLKAVDRCEEKQVEQLDYSGRRQPINMTKTAILKSGWNIDLIVSLMKRDNGTFVKVSSTRRDTPSLEYYLTLYVEQRHLQHYLDRMTPISPKK